MSSASVVEEKRMLRVKDVMQTAMFSVEAETSIRDAERLMVQGEMAYLPVLRAGKPIGILTKGALRRAAQSRCAASPSQPTPDPGDGLPVWAVMTPHVVTLAPNDPAHLAARRAWDEGAACFLVMRHGKVVGMVTLDRLLDVMISLIEAQQQTQYQRLLVPTNFGSAAAEAVTVALTLARRHGAELTILHVLPRLSSLLAADMDHVSAGMITRIVEDCKADVLKRLRALVPHAHSGKVRYETADGEPAAQIVALAHRMGADLIVMGSQGRSGLKRLFSSDVLKVVCRYAPCPVLRVESPQRYELVRA